jgi:hypothetical protein
MLLREFLNRTGEGKAAVVGWGRGMGHKGHMYLADAVITEANEQGADPYFVVSRTVGKDDPITPEEKLAIYQKVFPKHGHIFHTATEEMPDLTRVLRKLNEHGYTKCTVVVGADQVNALSYVKKYNGVADKEGNIPFNFTDGLDVISRQMTKAKTANIEGPRATPMRAVLADPAKSEEEKFAIWRDAMSPELDDDEVRDLMHKAQTRMQDFNKPKAKKEKAVGEDAAGVGIITKQNSTVDVNKNTPTKNLKAFNLVKEANRTIREMKATEFMGEAKAATMRKSMQRSGIHAIQYKNNDTYYDMYRLGIAIAGGKDAPSTGPAGPHPTVWMRTPEEEAKIKVAEKVVGMKGTNIIPAGNTEETTTVDTVSPVAKPKRNKYGV